MKLSKKQKGLVKKINQLKKEKNAIILVHNYQKPEIYEVADFIGDSLELARKAKETSADIIVFCGVDFMAESAKILNPNKKVLLPALLARCPMANMADFESISEARKKYPNAAIVAYVNTSGEAKAASDICCTSANIAKVVNSLDADEVIVVPDKNLGDYAQRFTKKKIITWTGHCYVHDGMKIAELISAKKALPDAVVIAHPECPKEIVDAADYTCSTAQMKNAVSESIAKGKREFIIGTEVGMIELLMREFPDVKFYALPPGRTCMQMKRNSLELVFECLNEEKNEVRVDEKIRDGALNALNKMLDIK